MKKYINGQIIEMTPEEIAELQFQQPPNPSEPTLEEKMNEMYNAFKSLGGAE